MPSDRTAIDSTAMAPQYKDMAPGLDARGMASPFAWMPRIAAKVADYTCLATESGTLFTNVAATKAITFTLPAIALGPWQFWFAVGADQSITVASGTVDTMITFNDAAADSVAFSTSSEKLGGVIWAFCDGTSLFCVQIGGVSHRQTLTVAT